MDTLDEVAARLGHDVKVVQAAMGDVDLLPSGVVRGFLRVPGLMWRMMRAQRAAPDRGETLRLYRQATGKSRDDANADISLVQDRLQGLFTMAPDEVDAVARKLVHWVAAGRPPDRTMRDVNARYEALAEEMEKPRDADAKGFLAVQEAYVRAWRTLLARQR